MGSEEQNILVTGGAGFIGTHTVVQLLDAGYRVSIIDNLDNSVIEAVHRVKDIVGPEKAKRLEFYKVLIPSPCFVFYFFNLRCIVPLICFSFPLLSSVS